MGMERRRSKRIDVNIIPDEMYPIGGAEIIHKRGEITNISSGGLAIDTKDVFKVGDNVYLLFALPNGVVIKDVFAHIIRISEKQDSYSIGVRFINIKEEYREMIMQYTASIATRDRDLAGVDTSSKPGKRKKREKGIYKTAFRKPQRNKEFLEALQSGATVKDLMDRFQLSESGISMLKKRLMKRDTVFTSMEKKFKRFDLKKYRKLKGMTQEELAKVVGVRRETITRWEKKLFEPSSSYKWKLMKILATKRGNKSA